MRYMNPRLNDTYRFLLKDCLEGGSHVAPRGKRTKELDDVFITLPGHLAPSVIEGRTDPAYMANEIAWYLQGSKDPTRVAEHAKMWDNCRNPDGTVNSNYGVAVFDAEKRDFGKELGSEWLWSLERMKEDRDTRQAVMVIHRPQHHWNGNKDLPCTLNIRFRIQRDALVTRAHMRSCDLWWGLPYDIAWFQVMHRGMWDALDQCSVKTRLGDLHIQLDSAHLYERHWEKAHALTLDRMDTRPITNERRLSKVLVDVEAMAANFGHGAVDA